MFLGFSIFKVECSNPSLLPEPGTRRSIEEPFVKVSLGLTFCSYISLNYENEGKILYLPN